MFLSSVSPGGTEDLENFICDARGRGDASLPPAAGMERSLIRLPYSRPFSRKNFSAPGCRGMEVWVAAFSRVRPLAEG